MPRWLACRVRVEEAGEPVHEDADARLGLQEGAIWVAFLDDEGPVVLEGRERGEGCYELVARSRPRRATLALDATRRRLDGEWQERERRGAWRIELDAAEAPA